MPVVVQDALTGEVRMVAFATLEAVRATLKTGRATFWSRSRGELWEKGRTSGNTIQVKRVLVDCDADYAHLLGGAQGASLPHGGGELLLPGARDRAEEVLLRQKTEQPQTLLATARGHPRVEKEDAPPRRATRRASTTRGAPAIGAKLREEATELANALEAEADNRVVSEAADVLYHLLVGLRWRAMPFRDVLAVLAARLGTSGHEEKARRHGEHDGR